MKILTESYLKALEIKCATELIICAKRLVHCLTDLFTRC